MHLFKGKKKILFSVSIITATCLFLVFQLQADTLSDIGPISLTWSSFEEDPLVPGFLYTHTFDNKNFFISTDTLLSTSSLTIATGTLNLSYTSSFFNPNACSKMPNAFLNEFMMFRDHLTISGTHNLRDILFLYNTKENILSQTTPTINIVGDLYTHDDYLYFFFENNPDELYLAYSATSTTQFNTIPLTTSFIIEKMRFYAAEPVFTYTTNESSGSSKYVFNFETREFERKDDYKRTSQISTAGGKLTFLFPKTGYTFIDEKQYLKREQTLTKNGVGVVIIDGNVNAYPIGAIEQRH